MSVRLFVGNLSYDVTQEDLTTLFGEVGELKMVRLPVDRETGRPRGFAFVEFAEAVAASEAMSRFNQQVFMGRPLVVNEAVARENTAGAAPRPMGSGPGAPAFRDAGSARPPAPVRTFGPDSLPQNKRKGRGSRTSASENRAKAPLKEIGGRAWSNVPEDETDEVPFWAVHDGKGQDQE